MEVKDLRPAAYNPRKITEWKLRALGKAMQEFGDLSGVIRNVRTGNLIGGHQRLKHFDPAWKINKEKHEDNVGTVAQGYIETPFGRWTYREVDWDLEKEKAANIAANEHGGEFDLPALTELLLELDTGAFDMDLVGFSQEELENLLAGHRAGDGEIKEDDFDADAEAEKIEEPITKPGDIWILGRHRLMCGDATSNEDIAKLMAGGLADMIWTDPPYGVSYTEKNDYLNKARAGIGHKAIAGDDLRGDDLQAMLQAAFQNMATYTKPGGCVYVAHADINSAFFRQAMADAGIYVSQSLIWVKSSAVLSRNDYNWKHEPILYGWREGAAHYFCRDFTQTTVIDDEADLGKMTKEALATYVREILQMIPTTVIREDRPARNDLHPTMKPIGLVARHIRNSSKTGENVLDLFGGSGTTLMAAEQTGRNAFLSELDAKYVDVIKIRWEQFAGKTARKEET